MTIRETTMPSLREASPTASFANAKLQQLSEPLLQEVTDFIDFVIQKHQVKIADS
ncbi:DUF2281 domain-containing protein [Nostoc sp. CHAB 5784]|uniref:DUF2281 domain-containing protein n=1 Tax=Nostoc mirabile TaxID=2907820 RepID=UPI001E36B5E8|nr:DUF2281 domain-containing protein [Nostoc mirabile]MCC5663493.1 DUF2281 domain-containing protein [Nostoc mirabile CHAB5784]